MVSCIPRIEQCAPMVIHVYLHWKSEAKSHSYRMKECIQPINKSLERKIYAMHSISLIISYQVKSK